MAIIDVETQTKLLRKVQDNILDYEALKLPISELRINESSNSIVTNPILNNDASNVCTWSIPIHSPEAFVQIQEVSTNNTVVASFSVDTELRNNVSYYTLNIYIKSSNNIPANTYKAVIIG